MDNLKRKFFLKYEIKRILIKSLKKNSNIFLTYKYYGAYINLKTPKWARLPQIGNRCTKTGRSLSVNKKTHLSRFVFRKESYIGHLPGFKRASW